MPDAISTDGHVRLWSIAQLAHEFGSARETVAKRLREANVRPEGKRAGHPVYRLKDAAPAIAVRHHTPPGGIDPDKLPPADRDRWYASEMKRRQLQQEDGELLRADDVRHTWASSLKAIVLALDTLADVVERDAGLTPEQAAIVQRVVDQQREALYHNLIADTEDTTDAEV